MKSTCAGLWRSPKADTSIPGYASDVTTLLSLADERFVSLTTFRKTGVPVSTPVWIGRDGDSLIVTTPEGTGKVKRLRNNARVELRPCTRTGSVADDAPVATGTAVVTVDAAGEKLLERVFSAKYGNEYRAVMFVESAIRWLKSRGKAARKTRALIRITEA